VIDDVVRFVDVMQGAIAQSSHRRIIFFARDVIVGPIQQFLRAVKATGAIHSCIDRRMIVQILSVIDRSSLDFVDGFVDLFNGVLLFLVHVMGGSQVFQVSAGMPQIGERVQICRMPPWLVGKAHGSADRNKKHE
jgi:hypothetical protein